MIRRPRRNRRLVRELEEAQKRLEETEAKDAVVSLFRDAVNWHIKENSIAPRIRSAFESSRREGKS